MNKQLSQKQIKVKLVRSTIGIHPKHKACVKSLGLRRINHTVEVIDTPCIRGVIEKINYLLLVEGM